MRGDAERSAGRGWRDSASRLGRPGRADLHVVDIKELSKGQLYYSGFSSARLHLRESHIKGGCFIIFFNDRYLREKQPFYKSSLSSGRAGLSASVVVEGHCG